MKLSETDKKQLKTLKEISTFIPIRVKSQFICKRRGFIDI